MSPTRRIDTDTGEGDLAISLNSLDKLALQKAQDLWNSADEEGSTQSPKAVADADEAVRRMREIVRQRGPEGESELIGTIGRLTEEPGPLPDQQEHQTMMLK